jgi:cellulose synthase/poly-beta-1,6-N-acetylglucosamine synthase-like glycosyltransferase
MVRVLIVCNQIFFFYYLACNLIYVGLFAVAWRSNTIHRKRIGTVSLHQVNRSPFTPAISIVVPAHNEAASIVANVEALLKLEYPKLEIIVVNDGSTDGTLGRLIAAFNLRQATLLYIPEVPCGRVRRIFASPDRPHLLVLDKESRGSKADAINAGLNAVAHPYVCVVDADSLLEHDALVRIMAGVLTNDVPVSGIGGIVRVINGCKLKEGQIVSVELPPSSIERLQVVEYLRAFLIGRGGWGTLNLLPIISGAFGVFSTELVRAVGGFRPEAIGEDLDLVIRMHRHVLAHRMPYRIAFVPDPTCWTEVPSDIRSLGRQRARWQKGLMDVLAHNADALFRPRYGRLGWIMLPYLWIFELAAPAIELAGFASIAAAAALHCLNRALFVNILVYGFVFATMISIGAVVLEELTYRRYNRLRDLIRLMLYACFEHVPYRQMNLWWRLRGMWEYVRGDLNWKQARRSGFAAANARGHSHAR